jgi:energy-coupling factor transporter ATP-binding protein EcfA2
MITNLQFENFRGFSDLRLSGLKRVNLIVGHNNAGKTSLLEGIILATDPQKVGQMPLLLRTSTGNFGQRYFRWLIRDRDNIQVANLTVDGPNTTCRAQINRSLASPAGWQPTHSGGQIGAGPLISSAPQNTKIRCCVVAVQSMQHRSPEILVKLFAQAVKRKGGEERIEKLMRMVDNRILKIRVEPAEDGNHIMVDLGLSEMLPVSQVGQGVNRLLAIFSELIGEQPELCIIDEVENGIHHSLLEQVWTGLAAVAEEMNIQIFLTTHSHECICSAHEAFSKQPNYDFSIIQLFRVENRVQGRVLDRQHIEASLSGDIDLR